MSSGTLDGTAIPVMHAKLRVPAFSGLARDRLTSILASAWDARLVVVTGPAGSGKTTLLAQYAASLDTPVAWYQAEPADGDEVRLLMHLHEGLAASWGSIGAPWESVDVAVAALESFGRRALLVIDDLQALEGTPSEAAIERLSLLVPPGVAVIVASRRQPRFNLSRLRVAEKLVEIDSDALRFRSWEVERLFHDVYAEPLPPEDLATLARRTEGWAAGLQLFHLATRGKPASERRRLLRNLSSRSRLVREYLTQNVIDELPRDLRMFLIETCVLGRLSGSLCDAFLGRIGTSRILEEILRRQIFLCPLDERGTFRYHEVLRSHLEACLVDEIGEQQARRRYARAGAILESAGACSEALLAYSRAGHESAAVRLLSRSGGVVADDPGTWIDLLPTGLADHDPWLTLAAARHQLAAGHWRQALATYQRLDPLVVGSGLTDQHRRERLTVTMWLEPVMPPGDDWVGITCRATRKDPAGARRAAASLSHPTGQLAAGIAALLAGQFTDARTLLLRTAEDPATSPSIETGAWLAAGIAGLLNGVSGAIKELRAGRERAEDLGLLWLARLGSCAEQCLVAASPNESRASRGACQEAGDLWGDGLIGLLQGFGWQLRPEVAEHAFLEAAGLFRQLGASVLEAWARAGAAVAAARAGDDHADQLAATAEASARSTSTWGALVATYQARALANPSLAAECQALANQLDAECVVHLTPDGHALPSGAPSPRDQQPIPAVLRCFGDFSLTIGHRTADLSEVKPRVRSLVRLLALHVGRSVHRETLIEALWPGTESETGTRNLHVAVSTARQVLERLLAPGVALVVREGDAYRLALPDNAEVDLESFERQLQRARQARSRGDTQAEIAALAQSLALYRGDVLALEGPAEWVLEIREHYRGLVVDAAEALAQAHGEAGDYPEAARACERGLAIDRYRDRLWRLRVEAHRKAGDLAAATLARRGYLEMLSELGVAIDSAGVA
jgi:DNA-binding SARP family transcriptional activator